MDQVTALLREAAAAEIMPRYRSLKAEERFEKSTGEIVTAADHAVEARLREALRDVRPDAAFVGEETHEADPGQLAALTGDGAVWVVDPVDGTHNFAHGRRYFCVMVALVEAGDTVASWIHDPIGGWTARALKGEGADIDGEPLRIPPPPEDPALLRGAVSTRFLPETLKAPAKAGARRLAHNRSLFCAGHDYVALCRGLQHMALYFRTWPWDHAAGALLVQEAGGIAARFDGVPYRPADNTDSMLAAADTATWRYAHDLLLPGIPMQPEAPLPPA
ncbi:MAG: inositol monophosphatase [Acetobacterales bacterium]